MKEIKFRAWQKYHKKMLDVVGIDFKENGDIKTITVKYPNGTIPQYITYGIGEFALDALIFMQYTGLKDKNGVEIYDGDIVKIHNIGYANRGVIAKVEYNDGCSDLVGDNWRDYLKCYTCNHAVTVIGNIYENHDLLEVQHED